MGLSAAVKAVKQKNLMFTTINITALFIILLTSFSPDDESIEQNEETRKQNKNLKVRNFHFLNHLVATLRHF